MLAERIASKNAKIVELTTIQKNRAENDYDYEDDRRCLFCESMSDILLLESIGCEYETICFSCIRERNEVLKYTREQARQYHRSGKKLSLQSENIILGDSVATIEQQNEESTSTVQYLDSIEGTKVDFNPIADNSFYTEYTAGTDLATFLSRPVLIHTQSFVEGVAQSQTRFLPWHLFFNDTRIRKKIDNYSLISCNLKLKVLINASPFYFGCYLLAYEPLVDSANPNLGFGYRSILTASTEYDAIGFSQMPHLWIYPQNCQGGELTLPFINYKNWLRVSTATEFQQMGCCTLCDPVPLLNANSVAGQGITIQIYAWAEDVRVAAPTVSLAIQSRDEYQFDTPISKVASAISSITQKLGDLPIIGRYMTATSMIARGAANITGWLGFSNPPVIREVVPFKNVPFHAFSSSEISKPVEKFTLDPKNELSVDPRIVGLSGKDEMCISSFIQRESYLARFDWLTSDAVDHLIFASRVHPELIAVHPTGYNKRVGTPMAHIQHMFSHWRGDIIFRFRFICTKFHKGRVRITYDPNGNIIADTVTSSVCFTKIVDISKDTDVEIRVPYMQATPWCNTFSTTGTVYYGDSTYAYGRSTGTDNGTITVRAFNALTSPIATSTIYMMVSVRAADNLEFAAPKDLPNTLSYFAVQSTDEIQYDNPETICASNDTKSVDDPNRFLVCQGETIKSFRQLLRRTVLSRFSYVGADTTALIYAVRSVVSRFPYYLGWDPNGINSATSSIPSTLPYNFAHNTTYNWLAPCFIGQRGSSRWDVNLSCPTPCGTILASRSKQSRVVGDSLAATAVATGGVAGTVPRFAVATLRNGGQGQCLNNQITQTGISFEVPMYSQYRMTSTDPRKQSVGAPVDGSDVDSLRLDILLKPTLNTDTIVASTHLEWYHSIGTDFSLLFFLRVPIMAISTIPLAV